MKTGAGRLQHSLRLLLVPLAMAVAGAKLPAHPPVPAARPDRNAKAPAKPTEEKSVPVPEAPPPAAARPEKPDETEKKTEVREPEPVPGIHENAKALSTCYSALDGLGVDYSKEPAINGPGRCGIRAPVSISRILPNVTLKPKNRMRCATALALARWTKRVVVPAAEELGNNVHLTGLAHASAYVCRHRDSIKTRKISQHAFGSAVDIVTFHFDGHAPLAIAPRNRTGKIEESFQRAVIAGACPYFTTVLGPRADSFHKNNLHLDVIERSHDFRLCQ